MLLKVDGLFGVHPALQHTHELYQNKQALFVHAVASPYHERSHFEGQDKLENGSTEGNILRDGWLNRALEPLAGSQGRESAIAISQNTPLVLRGSNPVTSWAPSRMPDASEETMRRIESLYANDEFFATRLAQAIAALQQELGSVWSKTVVMVVTEFGRTVKVNGTRGTDHGTATAALLVGGAVNGGRVVAEWPGLSASNLYEGRDLYPTTDIRCVFKGVLAQHLNLQEAFLDQHVFPASKPAPIIENLVNV